MTTRRHDIYYTAASLSSSIEPEALEARQKKKESNKNIMQMLFRPVRVKIKCRTSETYNQLIISSVGL